MHSNLRINHNFFGTYVLKIKYLSVHENCLIYNRFMRDRS